MHDAFFFFSSRRRHTRLQGDWSSDVCSSDLIPQRAPTDEEYAAFAFAWKVCKHVKSNAIVFARRDRTVGIGAGQMSRVDSVKLATLKAGSTLKGCVMASDADRKSTRLNSSHLVISYAVFCLKKKKKN